MLWLSRKIRGLGWKGLHTFLSIGWIIFIFNYPPEKEDPDFSPRIRYFSEGKLTNVYPNTSDKAVQKYSGEVGLRKFKLLLRNLKRYEQMGFVNRFTFSEFPELQVILPSDISFQVREKWLAQARSEQVKSRKSATWSRDVDYRRTLTVITVVPILAMHVFGLGAGRLIKRFTRSRAARLAH